jgi:hypothetical protein
MSAAQAQGAPSGRQVSPSFLIVRDAKAPPSLLAYAQAFPASALMLEAPPTPASHAMTGKGAAAPIFRPKQQLKLRSGRSAFWPPGRPGQTLHFCTMDERGSPNLRRKLHHGPQKQLDGFNIVEHSAH